MYILYYTYIMCNACIDTFAHRSDIHALYYRFASIVLVAPHNVRTCWYGRACVCSRRHRPNTSEKFGTNRNYGCGGGCYSWLFAFSSHFSSASMAEKQPSHLFICLSLNGVNHSMRQFVRQQFHCGKLFSMPSTPAHSVHRCRCAQAKAIIKWRIR